MEEKSGVKQTIMDKALTLFSAKGYEGVPVSELTEAAGITKPTLYYYFKSKEGLFDAVCKMYYEKLNKLITETAIYNPNPKNYNEDIILTLTKVTNTYFTFAKKNEAFFRITLVNFSMPSSSEIFKIAEKYHFTQFEIIDDMFKNMAKAHGNLKGKSKTLTWSFIGTINSYIGLYFSNTAKQNSAMQLNEKTIKELVHQFMHGIFS
ncbi:MAG: TetR/AcrR family transcriptional regulator [Treponema sp.]|nr:TetR/AcrR family transcriptional regulator [Treponema sp.]MCL2251634.1 TetR/AcrR family transcriptional regulator [Treponema sp.]